MKIDRTFLANASTEKISKLTSGLNPVIPKFYNILVNFNTKPNSVERLHWLNCCDILCRMN